MTAIGWMLRRSAGTFASVVISAVAAIAIAGLIAMHGMDAGSSGAGHAMAMPATLDAVVPDGAALDAVVPDAAALDDSVSHNTPRAQSASGVFWDMPAGVGDSVSHNTPRAESAFGVFWDMPAGAGDSVSHNTPQAESASGVFWDMPAGVGTRPTSHAVTHSGPMCALAPAPAHALPAPAETAALLAVRVPQASVVAPVETRAPVPPSLTALGVCRR